MIARTTGSLTFGIEIVHANVWLIDTWAARVHSPTMAGVGAAHRIYGTFGAQVRERRTAMGLTQLDLAALINLTRGSVANIEAGRQSVLLHQFMDIANALVMNPAQLLPEAEETPLSRENSDMPEAVRNAIQEITSPSVRARSRR